MNCKVLNVLNSRAATNIPAELGEAINQLDAKICLVNFIFHNDPKHGCFKRFVELAREVRKADIIHTHHTMTSAAVSLFCIFFKIFGKKKVFFHTIHNDFRFYSRTQKMLYSICVYPFRDCLIANSKNSAAMLPDLVSRNKVHVSYNGINLKNLSVKDNFLVDSNTLQLLSIGRMVKQKDQLTLLKVATMIKQKGIDFVLHICGDGPLRHELENFVDKNDLSANVKFYGLISRNEVYKIIAKTDVAIIPSLFEGFCNTNVEIMGSGVLLITTNVPPIPEVVADGAILVEPKRPNLIAQYVEDIVSNPGRYRKVINAALRRADDFSIENAAKRYIVLYKQLFYKDAK